MGFFSIFKKKNKGNKSDNSEKAVPKTALIQPAGNESASLQGVRAGRRQKKTSNEKIQETFENSIDDGYSEKEKDLDEYSEPGGMREEREAYEAAMKRKAAREQNDRANQRQPKLITGEDDEDIDIANDIPLQQPQEDNSGMKAPDVHSEPGGMREEIEAYEAAMRKWMGVPEPKKSFPEQQAQPQVQAQPQIQAQPQVQAQAQPQPQVQPQVQEQPPQFATNKDLVVAGPTVYFGDDTKAYAPVHRGKKGSRRQERRNQIEVVQEAQNPVANHGFQPVRLGPRTKFGVVQKAGNLAASAVSSVLTTSVMAISSPVLIPFVGYAEGNASFVSKYGQQSRRHDLIPGWAGAKFENTDASGEEILSDVRRVPTIWAKVTAEKAENEDGSPKAPEITVYAKQPNQGSSRTNAPGGAGHTFLGMRYTRRSPRSERNERYELIIGFYPNDEYLGSGGGPMTTKNVRIPGKLEDDTGSAYTISRRYPATNAQVNSIIKASETYADKGYNVFERNCTTFVNEMIRDYAHLNTGGKIFEKEEMRFSALDNTMRGGLGWATPFMDVYTLNKMAENAREADQSYAGYGNMKVTKDEIQRYKQSRRYLNPVKEGYTPAVTAENLRRIPGENNSVLGSFYYYRDLPVDEPDEPKAHPNASNLNGVNYDQVETRLAATGSDLSNAVMAILPQELQNNEAPMPPEIQDFIVTAATAVNPYGDLIRLCRNKINSEKDPKKRERLQFEDVVTFDEIKAAYDGLQGFEKKISRGFTQTFKGDTRIETPVMNLLSMISIAFSFINKMYQQKMKDNEKQSADLGDIRSEMSLQFDVKVDGKSINITANRYEAYLAIYRSPAAVVEGYSRLVQLRQADKDETITDDEKKELEKLEKIDSTADDFIHSHDYLLLKDSYSQQDLDYIFKLKAREKKGVKGRALNPFSDGYSAAGIYQALVMDKIFGGIKAAYLRDYEQEHLGNSMNVRSWLSTYLTECAWRHKKELDMVVRAIRRVTENHTEDTLYKYMSALVNNMYLQKVFQYNSREVGGRINAASTLIPLEMISIMEHQIGGFPTLLKAIIGEILREEPTKKKNKVRR